MFGYDAARLHASLNDLPAALLLVSVFFDLLGAFTKRESLKAAGFWTLVFGALGTGAAVIAGLFAEERVEHSDAAHAIIETHETLAFIVLGLFGILAIWRIFRRGVWNEKEQPIALTAGVIGVALLVYTGMLGGKLVFDHALGISKATMEAIEVERAGRHEHEDGEAQERGVPAPAAQTPSTTAQPADTAQPAGTAQAQPDTAKHTH